MAPIVKSEYGRKKKEGAKGEFDNNKLVLQLIQAIPKQRQYH